MAIFVLSLGFQSRFFHGSSPETLQGKNVLEDPRRNPRDRDFLFFLEIISGSPKMTSPKELPLKTSLELTPQQRLLSSLSWAGACSFDVEEYSGLGLDKRLWEMWCFSLHGNFGYMKFQPSNVDGGRIWRFLTTGIQFSNGLRKAEKMRTGSSRWKDWRDQGIYNPRHIYIYIYGCNSVHKILSPGSHTWRIIPVSKCLVTAIYKP